MKRADPISNLLRGPGQWLASILLGISIAAMPGLAAAASPAALPPASPTPAAPRGLIVLDQPLQPCSTRLRAGYARNGYRTQSAQDEGSMGCAR